MMELHMMELFMMKEAELFLYAVLLGFFLGVMNQVLALLRRLWHHKTVVTAIGDVLFWTIAGTLLITMVYQENDGRFRGYFLIGIGVGVIMSRRRKKRSTGAFSVMIIVIAFLMVMAIQIGRLKEKDAAYAAQEKELQQQYDEEQARAENIDDMAAYMKSNEYIEDVAKSKLGLAYENEIIFKERED